MARQFDELGFRSFQADPDVWMRPAIKENGEEYYEYLIYYVDNILCISKNATRVLEDMRKDGGIKYKNGKIEPPEMYLGACLQKRTVTQTQKECWSISSVDYINVIVAAARESFKGTQWKFLGSVNTPIIASYHPEIDETPELDESKITKYQEFIGMLRWEIELRRVFRKIKPDLG